MEVMIDGQAISFQPQYGKRTKMSYEFTPEGLLMVRLPLKSTVEEITEYLTKEKKTIFAKKNTFENRVYISAKKSYNKDETYLLFGRTCKLSDLFQQDIEDIEEIEVELKKLYTKATADYIKKRAPEIEAKIGVRSKSISIVDSKNSWGTCSSSKKLTFNYKLSMAKEAVIDSVIIHELCHIHHMNHDRSFWRLVGKYDNYYKEHLNYLSRFGGVMTI